MTYTYKIKGMTCNGCKASVADSLSKIDGVQEIDIDLKSQEAVIAMSKHIALNTFRSALPTKYGIAEKEISFTPEFEAKNETKTVSKLEQLKPLFLIFLYLFSASILLNYKQWDTGEFMLDFMGLFFIVFNFFKLLDLKGFPEGFRMYDPLAKAIPFYGRVYPFVELILGLFFLMRFQITLALVSTIFILGITTIGVTKTLLDKKSIRCACLGTVLKIPMTEATFIENFIMLVMAISMLILQFT